MKKLIAVGAVGAMVAIMFGVWSGTYYLFNNKLPLSGPKFKVGDCLVFSPSTNDEFEDDSERFIFTVEKIGKYMYLLKMDRFNSRSRSNIACKNANDPYCITYKIETIDRLMELTPCD